MGAGAGTQYTEDAVSVADPVGTQMISRRRDALASEVSTDGDVIAVNSTSKGELYVKHTDAIPITDNSGSLTIDGTVGVSGSVAVTNANLDAGLSTLATQSTLALVKAKTDNLDVALSTKLTESTYTTRQPVQGQAVMASSVPVVIASNQSNLSVTKVADTVATQTLQNAVAANGNGTTFDVAGYSTAVLEVTGTFTATVNYEASNDDATWFAISGVLVGTETIGTTLTTTGLVRLSVGGIKSLRARVSGYSSGNVTVKGRAISDATAPKVVAVNNLTQMNGNNISLNTGVRDAGTQRVTIATNDAVPVTDNSGSLTVDQSTATNLKAEVVGPTADNAANPTAKLSILPAVCNTSDPTYTNTNVNPLSVTTTGRLRCAIGDWLGSTAPTVGSKTSTNSIPVVIASDQGAIPTVSTVTNLSQQGGVAISLNTGVRDAGTQRVTIATNDVVPVTDNSGSLTVDNAGTFAVQDSEKIADNGAFTDGTTKVLPLGLIYDEVAGTALTENDIGTPRMNVNRSSIGIIEDGVTRARYATVTASNALKVDASGAAVPVTDNSGSLTVDNSGTFAVQDSEKITDNAGFTDGTTKVIPVGFIYDETAGTALTENDIGAGRMNANRAMISAIEDGATRARYATVTASNALKVDASGVAVPITDNSGTLTVDNATASNFNAQVVGEVAHDGVDSGNPQKIGGKARQTNPTAVADADRVDATFDDIGRQVVILNQVRDLVADQTTTITASTSETTIGTAVASTFLDLVLLTLINTSATATRVDFRDTTAGSVRFSLYVPAGSTIGFAPPVPVKQATVNTNWTAQCGTSVTDVRIFIQFVKNV